MSDTDPLHHDGGNYPLANDDASPPRATDESDSAIGDTESYTYALFILFFQSRIVALDWLRTEVKKSYEVLRYIKMPPSDARNHFIILLTMLHSGI